MDMEEPSQKPHVVLIPGAWHKADAYSLLTSILEAEGYEVTALTLPSVGAEPPITSLDPEIDHIRSNIIPLLEQSRDVVVVMHSYAGAAGSSSMTDLARNHRAEKGLPGGVTALVYLCAWMTLPNQSVRSSGGGQGGKGGPSTVKVEGDYIWHLNPISAFYNDLPQHVAEEYAAKLTHHSLPTLQAPLSYPAYRHIPSTYLVCTQDNTIPYQRQLSLIEETGCSITTFTCDAGHSPFLSQPQLTARVVRSAAGEQIKV